MPNLLYDEQGYALNEGFESCHCCHPISGIYLGLMEQWVSIHCGLPAGAYLDAPPEQIVGKWPRRMNREQSWELVDDLRGQKAYNINTHAEHTITEPGPLASDLTLLAPGSPFDKWDGTAWVYDAAAADAYELATASSKRAALLAEANEQITYLSEAIDLGMATAEEQASHTAWRQYRVLLGRVDITKIPINWPVKPV